MTGVLRWEDPLPARTGRDSDACAPDPLVADLLALWPGTRKALARRVGVHYTTVVRWHLGTATPTLVDLRGIARAVSAELVIHPACPHGDATTSDEVRNAYEWHLRRGEKCDRCTRRMREVWAARKRQVRERIRQPNGEADKLAVAS